MFMLKQVWQYRVMLSGVVQRDLRTRYAGSALGMSWTLLQPLLHFALYFVVFSWIFQVKFTEKANGGDFALYLLAGLLPWLAFQDGVLRAASVIVDYGGLVKGMRFPAAVLVAGSVCASFVNFLIGFAAFVVVLVVIGQLAWVTLPFLSVLFVLQLILTLGLGLIAASFYVFLRDTMQILQMGFMIWFYLTPIIYPPSYVPQWLTTLFNWNPLTSMVTFYRATLLEGALPAVAGLLPLLVWTMAAGVVGSLLFRKVESGFADVL
jgi:ABC-type polysaccharide/polyol phosphate export permease